MHTNLEPITSIFSTSLFALLAFFLLSFFPLGLYFPRFPISLLRDLPTIFHLSILEGQGTNFESELYNKVYKIINQENSIFISPFLSFFLFLCSFHGLQLEMVRDPRKKLVWFPYQTTLWFELSNPRITLGFLWEGVRRVVPKLDDLSNSFLYKSLYL